MENDRLRAVTNRLFDHVKSPSLRHIKDPQVLHKLARDILEVVDRAGSVWSKWTVPREELAKAAANSWIPTEDLREFLSRLPGPALTATDVTQRLRAIWEQPWTSYPNEELKAGCLALYEIEKAQGTDMPAIVGAIQEYIEFEEERLRREREEAYKRSREEARIALQQRFMSGADCGWTLFESSQDLFCRRNGRAFRITQAKDKRWKLYRIKNREDAGILLGTYLHRRDANKVLEQIAYLDEPLR
uniref:Uncharacterized protein n=1 Tax=Rhodopseudomonas palustris (strain BisA53) TaxID=316055 RepID=Q07PN6_RHOP5